MKAALTAASLLLAGTLLGAPTATATTTVPAPAPSLSPLVGLSGDGPTLSESDADLGRDLDAVKASGAGWVRVGVDWSAVEQTQGTLDWSNPDRQVNAAAARGLKVLGITTYTPSWAQAPGVAPGDTHGRPASATVFGTFAGQAAQHYAGRIDTWEMWNEPPRPVLHPAGRRRFLRHHAGIGVHRGAQGGPRGDRAQRWPCARR